jgi:hypothetical protein
VAKTFVRNMEEKSVKRELFLLEFEEGFEQKRLKGKMSDVISRSCTELKERFYEIGMENGLPSTWEEFKVMIIEFCTGISIFMLKKYGDMTWYDYCVRLKEMAKVRCLPDEEVFRKLRKEKLPQMLQVIVYSYGISIDEMLVRVKEFESNGCRNEYYEKKKNYEFKNSSRDDKKCYICGKFGHLKYECKMKSIENIQCFKCHKHGHFANNCPERKNNNNNVSFKKSNSIYERMIILEGVPFIAVFDTGAS